MFVLEAQVNRMLPLIERELECVDRNHAKLTQLSTNLVEAINMYHMLMRESENLGPGQYFHINPNIPMPNATFSQNFQPTPPLHPNTTFPQNFQPTSPPQRFFFQNPNSDQ